MNEKSEKLRQIQLIEIEILKFFDAICKKHKLSYYIDWGTLLGSIRHDGFIPWDDDIDLAMPLADYKKMLEIMENELPDNLFLQTPKTDISYKNVEGIKIRDRYSNLNCENYDIKTNKNGIFIEVFPIFKMPKNKFFRKLQLLFYRNLVSSAYQNDKRLKTKIRKFISKFCSFFYGFSRLEKCIENMYKWSSDYTYRHTLHNTSKSWDHKFEKDIIFPLTYHKLEDMEVPVPKNYDAYLKILYGDYKKLPPEEERIQLHLDLKKVNIKYKK